MSKDFHKLTFDPIIEPTSESSSRIDEVSKTQMFRGEQLYFAPRPALTVSDATLANAVIRIGEIEVALKKLRLLK